MRTDLAPFFWNVQGRVDEVGVFGRAASLLEFQRTKRVQIPSVGSGLCRLLANEFVQRGWRGEFPFGDKRDRSLTAPGTGLNARP